HRLTENRPECSGNRLCRRRGFPGFPLDETFCSNTRESNTVSFRMGPEPEADLLARCRRGEPTAWDELFDRHYAAAGRFIFQLGPDLTREDTEEICQETFLSVIKNLNSFQADSQFQTWLFRIAANK